MNSQKKHLRHVMLHCFKKGSSAKDTADEICTVYGSGTTTIRTVRNWFKKFRTGNFDLRDEDRSGRPATTDTDLIKSMLAKNPRYSVREIVDATNIPRTTVHNHLIKMGYENRPSSVAKPGLHPKKIFLCIWWDWKASIAEKWPELMNWHGVIFHHDNARPHVALAIRQKLLQFDWDVLPHLPYSSDLAPFDYYLFLSLKNSLRDKCHKFESEIKKHLDEYFASLNNFEKRA
ncbi:histone-lysine N-methyltransferase SETMAR-like [Vespa crabro]|uniref:histone-lysine N-methyltransferase SETMAR-like n=1 Tax=Vespa crabro TaxID=7445 RepID=UPI001EFFA278|nr:histone-lysine N-methyltransferase SETMAR-like [Vespa crabro]